MSVVQVYRSNEFQKNLIPGRIDIRQIPVIHPVVLTVDGLASARAPSYALTEGRKETLARERRRIASPRERRRRRFLVRLAAFIPSREGRVLSNARLTNDATMSYNALRRN